MRCIKCGSESPPYRSRSGVKVPLCEPCGEAEYRARENTCGECGLDVGECECEENGGEA